MEKKSILLIVTIILCGSCTHKQKPITVDTGSIDTVVTVLSFPELEAGEIFYKKQNPFGETVELTGKNITGDTVVFKPGECEMLIKDDRLIMKNIRQPFRIFSLPNLTQQKGTGMYGNGPDEFLFPTLVPTSDTDKLCYLFEATNQKLYKLHEDGTIIYCPSVFNAQQKRNQFGEEMKLAHIEKNDFAFVANSPTGKSIYRTTQHGDSLSRREVFNLALNARCKSPFAYIGSFAVNPAKNRMAYAYKYFKIIKFMDLEAETVRTINFARDDFDDKTPYIIDGLDQNITHYWGACAQENYVYFLYSGRTPYEVVRAAQKENYYIYVEQYDWNGIPIRKYKLDQWGYFTVDEKNEKLYLTSTNHDDPFFEYNLNGIDKTDN